MLSTTETTSDEQAERMTKWVLWFAECPIKLTPEMVQGILNEIRMVQVLGQMRKWSEERKEVLAR